MFEQAKGDLEAANETMLDIGRKAVKSALVEFTLDMTRPRSPAANPATRPGKPSKSLLAEKPTKVARPALLASWAADPPNDPAACLSFDAASRTIGWAALSARLEPVAFGVIRSAADDEETRAARLIDGVLAVAREWPGVPVVVEICKGIRHGLKSRSTDLATLARAQGRVAQSLMDAGRRVEMVRDTEWTAAGGSKPKADRAKEIRLRMRTYAEWAAEGRDEGMDISDAIGLGLFVLGRRALADVLARGAKA